MMESQIITIPLKVAKKFYSILNPDTSSFGRNWKMFSSKEYANKLIFDKLTSDSSCMIARFGAFELNCLVNYLGISRNKQFKSYARYIRSQSPQWWWNKSILKSMSTNAGFFPANIEMIEKYCELFLNDIKDIDVLGSWLKEECFVKNELANTKRLVLEDIEPFFSINPWTKALNGKKVLVVHPFNETIEKQYNKRDLLFDNNLLPEFELHTIKAVQSSAGSPTEFVDWFHALDSMKSKIDSVDYDICIIGAGAYGFSLAAHVKRSGKKAIHLAGVTQLLFGIKGNRWENFIVWPYENLYNEHWVRPGENERPKNATLIENACYW